MNIKTLPVMFAAQYPRGLSLSLSICAPLSRKSEYYSFSRFPILWHVVSAHSGDTRKPFIGVTCAHVRTLTDLTNVIQLESTEARLAGTLIEILAEIDRVVCHHSRSNFSFQLLPTSSDRVSITVNVNVPVETRDP